MITKTKVNQRMQRKTNPVLAETIFLAKKLNLDIAARIAVPSREQAAVNLDKINESKAQVIIIPGKVLSMGEITSKKEVYALAFSKVAKEKLKKAGCVYDIILNALKKNPKLKGEIIKND